MKRLSNSCVFAIAIGIAIGSSTVGSVEAIAQAKCTTTLDCAQQAVEAAAAAGGAVQALQQRIQNLEAELGKAQKDIASTKAEVDTIGPVSIVKVPNNNGRVSCDTYCADPGYTRMGSCFASQNLSNMQWEACSVVANAPSGRMCWCSTAK
jgi:hypothetical protein